MDHRLVPLLLCWALFFTHGLTHEQFGPKLPSLGKFPHQQSLAWSYFFFLFAGSDISPDDEPMSRVGPSEPAIEAPTTPAVVTASSGRAGRTDTGDLPDPNREADAVLKLLRRTKGKQGVEPINVKMGCFTESPLPYPADDDGSEKATANSGSSLSKPGLQSLLMQVVGQVANYNERIAQETDNRKAIVRMLESYIKNQQESLKRSETILNEYRSSIPKYSE